MDNIHEALLEILSAHRGKSHSISLESLCFQLSVWGTGGFREMRKWEVREWIHELRQQGHLIASSERGYFLPATLQEAFEYIEKQFRVPSRDQLLTARIQRRAAQRQFGGQFQMEL